MARTRAAILGNLLVALAACLLAGCASLAPTRGTTTSPDGVEIAYEVAGTGDPTLVFVHGWCCDRSYWREQVEHFSATQRVVAIDLGGHGESGLNRENWTMQAFGADIAAVLDALDVHGAVLVGHSMGGPAVVEAACLAPERVAALVAVDTFNQAGKRMPEEERESFSRDMRANFRNHVQAFVRSNFFRPWSNAESADRISADMASAPPGVAISAMRNLLEYEDGPALARVKVPMCLIQSDQISTDILAARAVKPDVDLAVLPRVGHFLMVEDAVEFDHLLERAVSALTAH